MTEICRKAGISLATYFNWKKKCVGLLPSEMRHCVNWRTKTVGCSGIDPRFSYRGEEVLATLERADVRSAIRLRDLAVRFVERY